MKKFGRLLADMLALCAPIFSMAQQQSPVQVVNLAELSGGGAIAGTNFKDGVELGFKEINAAGGILGRQIEVVSFDTQTNPEMAKTLAQKAVDMGAYAVMGPVFSSSVIVSMEETRRAEIPNFIGAEADEITMQGNPYVFRTSLAQSMAMPKLARYIKDSVRAKSVALVWVNNEFGRGGRDAMTKALQEQGIKVAADLSTDPQQVDFANVVSQVQESDADAVFVYLHEEESAHCLQELYKQGYGKPILGETTLLGQEVIELAGEAANGVLGHVGLTPDALRPTIRDFDNKFIKEYNYKSDHNGMKGYIAAYVLKAVTEKVGEFDSKAFAEAMKGVTLSVEEYPGILLDVQYDDKGDLDRESFIVRVSGGMHQFIATLPPLAGSLTEAPAQQ
jgi:branched-chain amino acid transport system substrate-binding protein